LHSPKVQGDRTVGIDKGLREKLLRLFLPDPLPRRVDGFHERQQRALIKAARKISTGGRIRNPLRARPRSAISTRYNFVYWLALGAIYRGWARSASGYTVEGIAWIEQGMRDIRATGTVLGLHHHLALKAEPLHLADRTTEALEAINEAEVLVERFEHPYWCAELHRLRGVFLAALGAEENQIEASFCAAIRIAKEQKSVSLQKRAEETYAEYRRQKASASEGRRFRLPLW